MYENICFSRALPVGCLVPLPFCCLKKLVIQYQFSTIPLPLTAVYEIFFLNCWVFLLLFALVLFLCCYCLIAKSCPTICGPMNRSPPDSFVHGVGCHFLLQMIFLTQGSNLCLLHWQEDSLLLSHQGSPILFLTVQ